jgi:hypothetical protein
MATHARRGLLALLLIGVSLVSVLGVRAGRFNDFDVSQRERRPGFYALVIALTALLAARLATTRSGLGRA